MSYESALKAAGANVIAFDYFGSYQGDWWALVEFNGERGWVHGSFGSCSYCDAFQAEFDAWDDDEKPDYPERLAKFGAGYLGSLMTQAEAEASASEDLSWDLEAEEMVAFIKKHGASHDHTI